ncbi:unnamed protein product [Prunus armeniaca]|uniref:Uncharacterized protein n=1 Tax=Prunus armeniaca TaxID=36596 RepID=A0A6J5Y2I8_PRUAR|nr:unnamed protein product [Prunus armeniaca]
MTSNNGGEDLAETPSMVVATNGGTTLEEGQQPNFHLFKEKDLSKTVIQFKRHVLNLVGIY